jgi:hypothetical protein
MCRSGRPEGLGGLGGLPPQCVQGAVQGSAAVPQPPGRVVQVASVAFGVDHEHSGGADDQVVEVGGRAGNGQVVEDLVAMPLQGSQEPGGAPFAYAAAPPGPGVGGGTKAKPPRQRCGGSQLGEPCQAGAGDRGVSTPTLTPAASMAAIRRARVGSRSASGSLACVGIRPWPSGRGGRAGRGAVAGGR